MASQSYDDVLAVKTNDFDNSWKCPICMDAHERPKLLPCSHSFCLPCLEDLAKHHTSGSFPCPNCREIIKIPSGGVAAFKVNFYIEREKERPRFSCKNEHAKPREIELYCLNCCSYICLECKLGGHHSHQTEQIESLAEVKRAGLRTDKIGLDGTVGSLERKQQQYLQEQQNLADKKKAVKREIFRRHQLMVDMADRCRDESLFSLDSVTVCIDSQLGEQLTTLDRLLDRLHKLQKRIKRCVESEEGIGLLETAGEIYKDAGHLEEVVQNAQRTNINKLSRPVLSYSASVNATCKIQQQFLGPVVQMDMAPEQAGFNVEEMFCCRSGDAGTEVFSLFPRVDNTVWICYEPSILSNNRNIRCPEQFDFTGNLVDKEVSVTGRTNFMYTDTGRGMCITAQKPGYFSLYAKSRKLFKLKNNLLKGEACLISMIVASEKRLNILPTEQFLLRCGPHRGFDVNEGEVYVAVVEEAAESSGWQRRVRLYRQPEPAPIATYNPPSPGLFQPSDVCFTTVQGREALLVADEVGDCVHVLRVEGSCLVLSHHLAAGHPLLVQPTALNVDVQGHVWVACRGGVVLRLTPVEGDLWPSS